MLVSTLIELTRTRGARMSKARSLGRFLVNTVVHMIKGVASARWGTASDAGMSTAEYAIGTVAACAFAALLYKVVTSSQILDLLSGVVSRALHVPF
jgi:hypothetical protein